MNTRRASVSGFTLIELLVVIAIIGILASLTAAVLPRVLAKAKITAQRSNLKQIETALAAYSVDNGGSFPPRYGYIADVKFANTIEPGYPNTLIVPNGSPQPHDFVVTPYTAALRIAQTTDLYDKFAGDGIDLNRDGDLQLLEYEPWGRKIPPSSYEFDQCIFTGSGTCGAEEGRQLQAQGRFPVYIPVNGQQADRFAKFMYDRHTVDPLTLVPFEKGDRDVDIGPRPRPEDVDPDDPGWQGMMQLRFPPNKYDRYVLIGGSPDGGVFGMLEDMPQAYRDAIHPYYLYHWAALIAYFMATRDADGDNSLDFDYTARSQRTEANDYYVNVLPELARMKGGGPIIFQSR